MKPFLLLLFSFSLLGCSKIGVRGYYGQPLDKKISDTLVGQWNGGDQTQLTVSKIDGSEKLQAVFTDPTGKEKPVEFRLLPTRVGQDCTVLWADTEAEGFFLPLRIKIGEHSVVLFAADEHEIKSHIKRGELFSAPEKTEVGKGELLAGLYLIEGTNIEKYLESQLFWDLDSATPFLKVPDAGAKTSEPPKAE